MTKLPFSSRLLILACSATKRGDAKNIRYPALRRPAMAHPAHGRSRRQIGEGRFPVGAFRVSIG